MSEQVLLAADGLTRSFGRQRAVDGVSLELRHGEVLGFLGLNGAGKTTTMQMLAGALAADAGRVTIAGHDLARQPAAARRALGYLPQTAPLYDDMRVDEYLRFCARARGLAGAGLARAVDRARARCGLSAVGRRLVRTLSQGYRQRVGLAQAIVHEPAVLILDEPTTGLDPAQIREVRALIGELAAERAILISTHILPEVRLLATRVAILHHGRVVHDAAGDAARRIRVRLARDPGAPALKAIAGVGAVERAPGGDWLLAADAAVAGAVVAAAAEGDWGLSALVPDYDALEHEFLRVTAGEPAAAGA